MANDKQVEQSPEALRKVAKAFDEPIATLTSSTKTLVTDLGTVGQPWGKDKMGKQFEEQYVPARDNAIKALHESTRDLRSKQNDFNTMAANYEATDNANNQ
jgi:hypothetical protein